MRSRMFRLWIGEFGLPGLGITKCFMLVSREIRALTMAKCARIDLVPGVLGLFPGCPAVVLQLERLFKEFHFLKTRMKKALYDCF